MIYLSIFLLTFFLAYLLWFYSYADSYLERIGPSYEIQVRTKISWIAALGNWIFQVLPEEVKKDLELDYLYLDRQLKDLYTYIGQTACLSIVFLLLSIIRQEIFWLFPVLILPLGLILDNIYTRNNYQNNIKENIEHLVSCLKILVVKTETPLINALEIIIQDLPRNTRAMKKELNLLIQEAQKTGIKKTLETWKTDLNYFKDLLAFLIAINEGASKAALKQSFEGFLAKLEEERINQSKNSAENLQLYLMLPAILMLLVESLPLLDAIKFLMEDTNILGG